eukprot:scaffold29_cov251-Pinguiococcus_pyrenoidosus.AAC.57
MRSRGRLCNARCVDPLGRRKLRLSCVSRAPWTSIQIQNQLLPGLELKLNTARFVSVLSGQSLMISVAATSTESAGFLSAGLSVVGCSSSEELEQDVAWSMRGDANVYDRAAAKALEAPSQSESCPGSREHARQRGGRRLADWKGGSIHCKKGGLVCIYLQALPPDGPYNVHEHFFTRTALVLPEPTCCVLARSPNTRRSQNTNLSRKILLIRTAPPRSVSSVREVKIGIRVC